MRLSALGCLVAAFLVVRAVCPKSLNWVSWRAPTPRKPGVLARAAEAEQGQVRRYTREMRGTPEGGKFWGRKTDEKWGEYAEGNAGKFDKDDLVEAKFPETDDWYSAQVMRYVGDGDWIVMWLDDMPEECEDQASMVKTADMRVLQVQY